MKVVLSKDRLSEIRKRIGKPLNKAQEGAALGVDATQQIRQIDDSTSHLIGFWVGVNLQTGVELTNDLVGKFKRKK